MTSGEGGMVTTNDGDIAAKVRRANSLGYSTVGAKTAKITKKDIQDPDFLRHVTLGWNYRLPELCAAVALAQLENLDVLVQKRVEAAVILSGAVQGCQWLAPQHIPTDRTSAFWSYVVKFDRPDLSWHAFRDRFQELGGHGIYSAWQLTYLEPIFTDMNMQRREKLISDGNRRKYRRGACPVAEKLQPNLLQFKTNYWNSADAEAQADILRKTICSFE